MFSRTITIHIVKHSSPIFIIVDSRDIQIKLIKGKLVSECIAEAIRENLLNLKKSTEENKACYDHEDCYILISQYPVTLNLHCINYPLILTDWINYGIEDNE